MGKQKSNTLLFKSEQSRNIAIHIAIFLFYVLYFSVIYNSGLSADDMWNSNIQAAKYTGGPSPLMVMWNQMITWLKLGRVFPFSNYAAVLFSLIPSVLAYKASIVGMIYLNNLICGFCVKEISDSNILQFLYMLIFPIVIQLTPEFDSGLYCYHMLIQMVVLWCFLSLWCLLKYRRQKNVRYAVGSAVFYFLALGTYEVSFIFILAVLWVMKAKEKNWKSVLYLCLPDLIVFLGMGLLNFAARLFLQENSYQGISVNPDFKLIVITLLKQCSTCFPIGRYICSGLKYCYPYSDVYPYSISGVLSQMRITDLISVILFIGLILRIGSIAKKERVKNDHSTGLKKNSEADIPQGISEAAVALDSERTLNVVRRNKHISWGLIGLGGIVFLFPGLLIAISAKYQQTLGWCSGHLPAYMQSIGLAIFLTGVSYDLAKRLQRTWLKKVMEYGCLCMVVIILLLNQTSGRAGVEYMNGFRKYPQENLASAAEAGFFDDIEGAESKVVFGTTAYIYDSSCTGEFYSKFTKSHIYAVPRRDLVNQYIQTYGLQDSYSMEKDKERSYYGIFNMAERDSGAMIMGRCKTVELNADGTDFQHVWIQNPKVFIRGEAFLVIPEDWTLLKTGEDYSIYELEGMYDIMQTNEYYENEAGAGVLYQ